jgi:hypothetical protein
MEKTEIQQVVDFLVDIREGMCEGDTVATLHLHLAELYRVIPRLMDATFATEDQDLKVLLAGLEHEARLCKQEIERRLGVRN